MNHLFFAQQNQKHDNNIIKDIIRCVRDAIFVLGDFFNFQIFNTIADYLNHLVGDTQSNDLDLHP